MLLLYPLIRPLTHPLESSRPVSSSRARRKPLTQTGTSVFALSTAKTIDYAVTREEVYKSMNHILSILVSGVTATYAGHLLA